MKTVLKRVFCSPYWKIQPKWTEARGLFHGLTDRGIQARASLRHGRMLALSPVIEIRPGSAQALCQVLGIAEKLPSIIPDLTGLVTSPNSCA